MTPHFVARRPGSDNKWRAAATRTIIMNQWVQYGAIPESAL
jgi:hypothetical protein